MVPFVVSDINQWSAFFSKLLEVHSSLRASAFSRNYKTQTWNIKLINTAATISKSGSPFFYYDAVDKGRSPVAQRFGGFIVFAGASGEKVITEEASATIGYNITAQATARINATFDRDLHVVLNKWLLSHQEEALRTGSIVQTVLSEPTPMITEGFSLTPKRQAKVEATGERAYTQVFNTLLNKSQATFNAKNILRQAEAAGVAAAAKEYSRYAIGSSELANAKALKPITGAAQNNPALQKLVKIPNWYAIASIFSKVTGDQVETGFKPLTPSRRETGNYKLVYIGGAREILPPGTGGDLIRGYKLVTGNQLERLIGEVE